MANYTISLYELERGNYPLFDDDYNFYNPDFKKEFEKKFYNRFLMREIYCESVYLFKRQLIGKLNEIYPYYKQIYEAECESKGITFLLNKDLTETFERDVESDGNATSESNNTGNTKSKNKNKFYDLPQQEIDDITNSLTNITTNENENNDTSNSTSTSSNTGKSKEKTTLISKGNIGTTSSAELLQKWYDVMINIDSMILDELEELFIDLY